MLGDSLIQNTSKSINSATFELNFFSILYQVSKRMTIFLSIPETFIYGFGFEKPTLICSDFKNKELLFEENLTPNGINEGFKYFKETSQLKAPIAAIKTQNGNHDKSSVAYSVQECQKAWDNCLKQYKDVVIQRFVYTGKAPKVYQVINSLDGLFQVTYAKKNNSIAKGISQLLPGLQRNSTIRLIEDRNWLIRKKDIVAAKEVSPEFELKRQVNHLGQIIEKFYSSNKDCKLDSLETTWVSDKSENLFLINVKYYRVLNIIYKPIQMRSRKVSKHFSVSRQNSGEYKVIKRGKKTVEKDIKYRTKSLAFKSEKNFKGPVC